MEGTDGCVVFFDGGLMDTLLTALLLDFVLKKGSLLHVVRL